MKILELIQKGYIQLPYHWKEMWINASKRDFDWDGIPIDKVCIRKIKIDKKYLPNEVDDNEVFYMINNFEEEVWQPVLINEEYCLLDGQRRLRRAFHTCMKYIDVIMEKRKDLEVSRKMKKEKRKTGREAASEKKKSEGDSELRKANTTNFIARMNS